MSLIYHIIISIFYIAIGLIFFLEIKKLKQKKIFISMYKNHYQPACLLAQDNKILWTNSSFKNQFKSINIGSNFSKFSQSKILDKIHINYNNTDWITQISNLDNYFGAIFYPSKPIETSMFLELPFPILTVNKNNFVQEMNSKFKEMMNISFYENDPKLIKIILEQLKENEEAIWQTKEGLQPIKSYVKNFGSNKIIFLDNNIETIKLKRKAQESQHLQILGQLTSSIIHDFKNLLMSIYGFTESLNKEMPNNESLLQIKKNIEQAENLLKEFLNFIKDKPVENIYIEPKKSLPQLCEMIKKLIGSKIKLETNINTDGFIKISDTQLERILFNMVVNSKDAMPNGGIFKINTYKQSFETKHKISEHQTLNPGEYYIIEVSDNGPGIPTECIKKIFTPFFSTKKKGTGLGLSSSLTLATHCGGGITFNTSSNGTTFYIILPLINEIPNNLSPSKSKTTKDEALNEYQKKINNKTHQIILVEDEETIRNLIKKTLSESYEVISFHEGISALEEIEKNNFDCLITDAVLPGIDGIQLVKAANEINPESKIFLVSGYDFATLEQSLPDKLKNSIQYIEKPFSLKKLKETINKSLL